MMFGKIPVPDAEGAILAHSVRLPRGSFKKGRVLSADDIATLAESGIERVFAARLAAGDVPEDEAAGELASAIAGHHAEAAEPFTGRANVYAGSAGVAVVDVDRVRRINRLHESLTLATVGAFETVEPRQMLATVKIIPFATPRAVLDEALAIAHEGGPLVSVAAYEAHKAGLVVTRLPQTKEQVIEKSIEAVRARLAAAGSTLGGHRVVGHDIAEVADAARSLAEEGCAPILLFGASAIVDRGDVVPAGLEAAGGEVVHLGMPVDPGNLMMLGRLGKVPVIGVPSCARSPKVNGFDWVLQRVLAGLEVAPADIMDMGAGGLLKEIPSRPTPREGQAGEGVPKIPSVAAIVLAAGRSTRWGADNKLLKEIAGKPMVRHAVETALQSKAGPVIVVTGHEADAVRSALDGLDVRVVHNRDYREGLSTSLKAGIAAVPETANAAIVCLGDMPLVAPRHIDRLIAAFNPAEGRAICVPVLSGKRGNPVLWGADFFADMAALTGDIGAKHLMSRYSDVICEVEIGETAIFTDIDTPDAASALKDAG
ncbi:NTP transferase domain-containing protein [Kaustia mangrovi]|uniref:NTP transferase domain-containing protein n=1 Tax=Kaustia mangrovi TaxID=2593653 RepID=A0A7S8HAI0_9HYPH|nr:molybdopterin-binding/glycosyltransferase family 2 protein [Kaustia mangrovi]QPC41461.1 NTP transferase domain-containing protein [Kaustia mangrovi]